jgi:TetR/AcrR family transcriptional repressor of nem operon
MAMALATPPSMTTRDMLLDAAAELLGSVGYASFSYRDLAEKVGIRTASIHYHFPTKADLGVALVEKLRLLTQERERALTLAHPNVRDRLIALCGHIAENTCTGQKSCPINLLQAEYAVLPEAVQRGINSLVDEKITILTRWLDDGRNLGQLRYPGSPTAQARLVWAVIEYNTQFIRTHPEQSFTAITRQLIDTMSP